MNEEGTYRDRVYAIKNTRFAANTQTSGQLIIGGKTPGGRKEYKKS
ncbi:MAG TPA: hypothetical protein VHQ93_17615 [Chitinophagaceae bacterium]|jgi:predicted alpha/beta-hydrolase family hydrolase|nr:hypothetical protein [Chitinophagaceae bacterium]